MSHKQFHEHKQTEHYMAVSKCIKLHPVSDKNFFFSSFQAVRNCCHVAGAINKPTT